MRPSTWKRVKALYHAACELPLSEREAWVESRAAMDPRAANETLRLLRAGDLPATPLEPIRAIAATRLRPGQVLAGRYEVRRFVAAGGFGEVYEAEDRERAERIALKIFRAEFASPDHVAWLRREVDLGRRVRHPNVCRVFDVVSDGGLVFLTMEFLDGETLASWLRREGALTERRALPLVRQMVAGLAAAHAEGVIHRDFKPGNVMIVPRPDGPPRAVITDFGMARASQDQRRTTVSLESSSAFGTPAYMAPEQVSGEPPGRAADVYSLGVVLHEMLTGELPFSDESPLAMAVRKTRERPPSLRRFAPSLRANWDRTIVRCLDPKPARRFRDVREVLTHLEARSGALLKARVATRWLRRHPWAIAAALLVLAGAVFAWRELPWPASEATQKAWRQGSFALHAGEPLIALRQWDSLSSQRLPARAPIDRALAWHALGFVERARTELGQFGGWSDDDRAYAKAAAAWIAGDAKTAKALLAGRPPSDPDAAWFRNDPVAWQAVTEAQPGHAGAHVRLAEAAVAGGRWPEAEREYLTASAWFQAHGPAEMLRAIAARRGLHQLSSGNADAARHDLVAGATSITALGTGPCEHYIVLQAGRQDTYQDPNDAAAYISPRFKPPFRRTLSGRVDGPYTVASLPLPPVRFCSGRLEVRMRRNEANPGTVNDVLQIGAAPFDAPMFQPYTRNLWAEYPGAKDVEFSMELKADLLATIQRAYAGEPVASLDLLGGDDTDFDYFKLILVY